MTLSFPGLGFGVLCMAIFVFVFIVLIITGILLSLEKNKKQLSWRQLKTTPFFFANIFTGILYLLCCLIIGAMRVDILFLDHTTFLRLLSAFFVAYFVPFLLFALLFKKRGGS